MGSSSSSSSILLFLLSILFLFLLSTSSSVEEVEVEPISSLKVIDLANPVLHLIPSPLSEYSAATSGVKHTVSCDRVQIHGLSRLKIRSYADSFRVTVTPSVVIPEKLHGKIQVCFHRNASLGLCQCEMDNWKPIQSGQWSAVMSPFEDKYVDLMFMDGVSGSITISVKEGFHQWRLMFLAVGFVILLLAPFFSNWVPFYYSSSMAIGVLLVVLIILFQGMRLIPAGRKNVFYLMVYGSVLGIGSFLVHYFSMLVNSILVNFGMSEDMHNPVSIFLLVGVVLSGAALGYWVMRKFVISEDGSVDVGIAQFVKWAMRIIAMTLIFQSTLDTPLAMLALASCCGICHAITSPRWQGRKSTHQLQPANASPWLKRAKKASPNHNRTEFLSRSPNMSTGRTQWNSPKRSFAWSDSPIKGVIKSSPNSGSSREQQYYSTFHKTPTRKRFSKKEWEDFTRESTREAMAEWASSPEFTDWIVENADRIRIEHDNSSDDNRDSGFDSSDETVVNSGSGLGLFNWLKNFDQEREALEKPKRKLDEALYASVLVHDRLKKKNGMTVRPPARVVKVAPSTRMGAVDGEGGFQFGSTDGKKLKVVPDATKLAARGASSMKNNGLKESQKPVDELSSNLNAR